MILAATLGQGPLKVQPHPLSLLLCGGLACLYVVVVSGASRPDAARPAPSRRQLASFAAGLALLLIASNWPLSDLARQWSLTAKVGQESLLLFGAAPLLVMGTPKWVFSSLTRPPALDASLRFLARPFVATVVFYGSVVGTFLPWIVAAQARSAGVEGAVEAWLLVTGVVMWLPVLRALPGTNHLSTPGRVCYLFVQSLLAIFPAMVFVIAGHSIYEVYAIHAPALGVGALVDQEIAGIVAKVVGVGILWGVAAVLWVRAERAESAGVDPDPLTWEDVERELRRVEKSPRRRSDAR